MIRKLVVSVSLVVAAFLVVGCGDSEPSTVASVLVRTAPPVIATPFNAQVFCGSQEELVAQGELGFLGSDPIVGAVWAAVFGDLPPGACTVAVTGGDLDEEPVCTGEESVMLIAGMLSEVDVILICTTEES